MRYRLPMSRVRRVADEIIPGVKVTPEGFVRLWVRIATPGRMGYPEHGYIAWVPDETLADPVALETLVGKPVTISEHLSEVNPEAVERHAVGVVLSVEVVGVEPYALIQIDRPAGIEYGQARSWAVGVSPGYRYEAGPGQNGADVTQLNRDYDHLTLTDYPRGGPRARAILTATDSLPGEHMLSPEKVAEMLVAAGLAEEAASVVASEIVALVPAPEPETPEEDACGPDKRDSSAGAADEDMERAADALRSKVATITSERDSLRSERDALAAKVDTLEKQVSAHRIASCRDSVIAAARAAGLKPTDDADVAALAGQVCERYGVSHRGEDAAVFLRDAARVTKRDTTPRHRSRDAITAPPAPKANTSTPSGMEF